MLAVTTVAVVRVRNLFAVAVLTGIYSFLMATVLLVLDAPDVALTEAAVGAGIGTVLIVGALYLTKTDEARPVHGILLPLVVAAGTAAVLLFGVSDTPPFGDPDNPIHVLGPDYLARSVPETGIPNVVSSVLASYRGFDTLGETVVIFTAGIAVLMLLKRSPRRRRVSPPGAGDPNSPADGA
jgi:multicomponent Na+:H+ antiporter subunit B